MQIDFSGRTIVITGGSSGIGLAAARLFAESGGTVMICGRNPEKLAAALSALRSVGTPVMGEVCDVSDERAFAHFAEKVRARFGRVDVWINNAGSVHRAMLLDETTASFGAVLREDLYPVFWGCRFAAALMPKGGVILNASSYSASKPSVGQGAYSAAKAAVQNLTATFASELAPRGIRVIGYAPGSIVTGMTAPETLNDAVLLDRISQRRLGSPEEAAAPLLFLASDAASYITGVCLMVDGGKLVTQAPQEAWRS